MTRAGRGGEWLDEGARRTLASLADVLIPSSEEFPSASEVGVAGALLDQVLRSRPDLEPSVCQLLANARDADPTDFLGRLEGENSPEMNALRAVVSAAYFSHPRVRAGLAYHGSLPEPIAFDEPPDYDLDGLLTPVIDRGPIYRSIPSSDQ